MDIGLHEPRGPGRLAVRRQGREQEDRGKGREPAKRTIRPSDHRHGHRGVSRRENQGWPVYPCPRDQPRHVWESEVKRGVAKLGPSETPVLEPALVRDPKRRQRRNGPRGVEQPAGKERESARRCRHDDQEHHEENSGNDRRDPGVVPHHGIDPVAGEAPIDRSGNEAQGETPRHRLASQHDQQRHEADRHEPFDREPGIDERLGQPGQSGRRYGGYRPRSDRRATGLHTTIPARRHARPCRSCARAGR